MNLSTTACWRRIQRLKSDGFIVKEVALLDRHKVNLAVTAFVSVRASQHSVSWLEKFRDVVAGIPEVVEFYRMSGDIDYLLRVVVPDIHAYDRIYKQLITGAQLLDVSSSFAMEELKYATAIPLTYAK